MSDAMTRRRREYRFARFALGIAACGTVVFSDALARAELAADRSGALLMFPHIATDSGNGIDSVIQIANAGATPATIECFYENAIRTCDNSSDRCVDDTDCPGGSCELAAAEVDFKLTLAAGQPFGWHASSGGSVQGAGTGSVPPAADPFSGSLRCVAIDEPSDLPVAGSLEGVVTLVGHSGPSGALDLAKYNAVAFSFVAGDGDRTLVLGGFPGEYDGCPNVWILQHPTEGVMDPISGTTIHPSFAVLPCAANLANPAETPRVVVHYLVFNELGQQLGTSKVLQVHQVLDLPRLHPTIFDAAVHGTLTLQTRVFSFGSGVVVVGLQRRMLGSSFAPSLATDAVAQGDRAESDEIVLP